MFTTYKRNREFAKVEAFVDSLSNSKVLRIHSFYQVDRLGRKVLAGFIVGIDDDLFENIQDIHQPALVLGVTSVSKMETTVSKLNWAVKYEWASATVQWMAERMDDTRGLGATPERVEALLLDKIVSKGSQYAITLTSGLLGTD